VKALCAAFLIFVMGYSQVLAATLNFSTVRSGTVASPITFPNVAISESSGGALFVYGTGGTGQAAGPQVCGLQSGFNCTGDVSLLFVGPVSNLTFNGYFASVSDRATISAYSDDTLISYALVSGNGSGNINIDFSGLSGITRVEIKDFSSALSQGIAYGDFTFDEDPPGPPAPPPPPIGLSFDALTSGLNEGLLDLGPALLSADGGKLFVYRTGDFGMAPRGGFCAFTTAQDCMGDFVLDFKSPIYELSFDGFFAKLTDGAIVSLFDGDTMLYTGRFAGSSGGTIRFDFTEFTQITRLIVEDDSDPETRGIAYGSFRYLEVATIPLPASAILLLAALGLLLATTVPARRRAQARTALPERIS
jgi:hypothetical protein